MTGATTPITVGGTLVLSNAECLLGLVIHQLKNPGAPFVYGYGNSPMDMKSMQAAYAHPAGMQVQGGMCDLARFYNLPSWGEAGNGCSKKCDEQAAMEASQFILMAALQGCNITHDVGYLDFGLSISFELLVICDEIIGRTKEIVKKVDTTEEYLAVDAIKRVGHGGNYLGDEHTFKHLRENWMGNISDLKSYGDWTKNGSLSMGERAHLKVKDILSKYEPEPLPKEVDKEIENILNRAKKKL
jgi:trimethylamine--corrinoid protein Co-methyltransferase